MPKIDFDKVDDVQDFSPVPDGQYLCRLAEVEETRTQYGNEMWKLRFVVEEGRYQGRRIFDNLVFSEAALRRVKLVCSRLGLNVSGPVDLKPSVIKGKTCLVTIGTEEYEDNEGRTKKRNVVPFAGYEQVEEATASATTPTAPESAEGDSEEDLPF